MNGHNEVRSLTATATAWVTVGPGDSLKIRQGRNYDATDPRVIAAAQARPDLFGIAIETDDGE